MRGSNQRFRKMAKILSVLANRMCYSLSTVLLLKRQAIDIITSNVTHLIFLMHYLLSSVCIPSLPVWSCLVLQRKYFYISGSHFCLDKIFFKYQSSFFLNLFLLTVYPCLKCWCCKANSHCTRDQLHLARAGRTWETTGLPADA